MQTTITKRGQTVVPAAIRKRYNIREGDQLVWRDYGQVIKVIPVSGDPVRARRGSGRGHPLTEKLLELRREDKDREP